MYIIYFYVFRENYPNIIPLQCINEFFWNIFQYKYVASYEEIGNILWIYQLFTYHSLCDHRTLMDLHRLNHVTLYILVNNQYHASFSSTMLHFGPFYRCTRSTWEGHLVLIACRSFVVSWRYRPPAELTQRNGANHYVIIHIPGNIHA